MILENTFWYLAFQWGWADAELLRLVVKTEANPFGEISEDDYFKITGIPFNIPAPVIEPEPKPETITK